MNSNLRKQLKGLNFIIASHIFVTGPALDLEEFLKTRVNSVLFIGHPFAYAKQKNSFYRFYQNGELKKEHQTISFKLPQLFLNIRDILYTIWWVLSRKKFHYYIGSDSMMAFLGLLLKFLGKVDNVILYTIDYMPQRFKSPILNWLYHFFDRICLKYCKVVWNVSPNMAEAREKYDGIKIKESAPQIVVPLGIWYKRVPKLGIAKKDKYTIVFLGHLIKKQGMDLVIKAMPAILKKIPRVKLLIIGTGEFEGDLKKLVGTLKIEEKIIFSGFVESHQDVEKMLAQSAVAVAMYKPDPESFTHFADPGKLKNYLAAGLPIFLTNVPHNALELQQRKCAFVLPYDTVQLADKIINFLNNKKLHMEYSQNAYHYASLFDWDKVFRKALSQSI